MSEPSSNPRGPAPAGVSALLALVLATISFFALAIFGLGLLSVVTDRDIVTVPGLGQAPGVIGMILAVGAFVVGEARALRAARPSFTAAPVVGLGVALVHLVALWLGVLIGAGDVVAATAVAADLVRGGASLVLLVVAAVAAWGGIALRRTRARHPRWPWEDEEE